MKTNNVRRINQAVNQQAMKGNVSVTVPDGRVIHAKTERGKLKVLVLGGAWQWADSVEIR